MADIDDLDEIDFDDDFDDGDISFDDEPVEAAGTRNVASIMGGSSLEGFIGSATDNEMIKAKVKEVLPDSINTNWESADEFVAMADKAKNNLVNPIRKEMVNFKRNINKVSPLVKRYLGETIGTKFEELTQTRSLNDSMNPDTQELANVLGNIFTEENKIRMESEDKSLVWDMMERQTDEDRFKMTMTNMHETLSNVRRLDLYNKTVTYPFQQKSLEYDIKRFHLLRQILEVNKTVGETSVGFLKSIVHNTSLPDLVKQRGSELFQQMFVQKWYGDTLEGINGMGRNMVRNFGKNLAAKASSTATGIVDAMQQIGGLAEMAGDMTEGQEDMGEMDDEGNIVKPSQKEEVMKMLAKQIGGGVFQKALNSAIFEIHDAAKDQDWFQKLTAQSGNLAANKNLFFKKFIEDGANAEGGLKGMLAPLFQILADELPADSRVMASLGGLNSLRATDARQYDNASRTADVDIVPGWLERIHNLILEILGRDESLAYDNKSGTFISKDIVKKDILDKIMTDEGRESSLVQVDKLLKVATKGIENIGDAERDMMREWIIREASTNSSLDISKMFTSDGFKDLNTYTPELAESVSGAMSKQYGDGSMYSFSKKGYKDEEANRHSEKMGNMWRRVVGSYSDDQVTLNDAISGGQRGILAEMGLIKNGDVDIQAILEHKRKGIDVSGFKGPSLRDLEPLVTNGQPPEEPPETPRETYYAPRDNDLPETPYERPLSTGPPVIDRKPPSYFRSDEFKSKLGIAFNSISGIKESTASILAFMNDNLKPSIQDVVEDKEKETEAKEAKEEELNQGLHDSDVDVKDYLSGILSTLASIQKANVSYYDNQTVFASGDHGLGSKVKDILGMGAGFIGKTMGWAGAKIRGLFGVGSLSLKSLKAGFNSKFSFKIADVYVGDEKVPRIKARDFQHREMFLRKDGEILPDEVKHPDDIVCELVDIDQNVIISQEEVDNGLMRVNRDGVLKRLGTIFGRMAGMGFDVLDGSMNVGATGWKLVKKFGNFIHTRVNEAIDKFKDVYIISEDGTRTLLATMKDLKAGLLSVEVDGVYTTVTKLSDLYKGNVCKLVDGEYVVIASMEDVKRGITEFSGKMIKKGSALADKAVDLFGTVASGVMGAVKLPFTVFGNMWKVLKGKFEGKLLDKIVLNIPKDVWISANVVYLNDNGRGHDPRPNDKPSDGGGDPKPGARSPFPEYDEAKKADSSITPESFNLNKIKDKAEDLANKAKDKLKARYAKLMDNDRVQRAQTLLKEIGKDPKALKEVIEDAYEKHGKGADKEKFVKDLFKKVFGNGWEEKFKAFKDTHLNKDALINKGKTFIGEDNTNALISGNKSINDWISNRKLPFGETTGKDLLSKAGLKSFLKSRFTKDDDAIDPNEPTRGSVINTTYKRFIDNGDKEGAEKYINRFKDSDKTVKSITDDAWVTETRTNPKAKDKEEFVSKWTKDTYGEEEDYIRKLKDNPQTLKDVINEAWKVHLRNNDNPISKEAFSDQWIEDKFGMAAPAVKLSLKIADKMDISKLATTKLGIGFKKAFDKFKRKDAKEGTLKAFAKRNMDNLKRKLKREDKEALQATERHKNDKTPTAKDRVVSGLGDILGRLNKRFRNVDKKDAKEAKGVYGDVDGDGLRDGGWKETLRDRFNAKLKEQALGRKEKAEVTKAKGGKGIMGMLLSAIGTLTSGLLGVGKSILGIGLGLGKHIASGLWSILKGTTLFAGNMVGGMAGGAASLARGVGGKLLAGGKFAVTKVKGVLINPVTRKVATVVAGQVAKKGAMMLAGVALAATPIGWAIGVAAAGWTAWEASVAFLGYYNRRQNIKIMEYLRHLQYGMRSGDNSWQFSNKISLRYFENEIIAKGEIRGGMIEIGATTEEIWQEYRSDFEDGGGDDNEAGFKRWYESRFLPVLYKWMSLTHTMNSAYIASQEGGFFGGKDNLAIQDLDDNIPKDIQMDIARQSMIYNELDFDPLMVEGSPSTRVISDRKRPDCQEFADKIQTFLKGTYITSDKASGRSRVSKTLTPKEKEEKAKNTATRIAKIDEHAGMVKTGGRMGRWVKKDVDDTTSIAKTTTSRRGGRGFTASVVEDTVVTNDGNPEYTSIATGLSVLGTGTGLGYYTRGKGGYNPVNASSINGMRITPAGMLGGDVDLSPKGDSRVVNTTDVEPDDSAYGRLSRYGDSRYEVGDMLTETSKYTGIDAGTLATVAMMESSMDANARAGTSTAKGLFQFINSTWKSMMGKHGAEYGVPSNASPYDPAASALMGAEYLKGSRDAAATVTEGDPTITDLYMGHFLGHGGMRRFIRNMRKDPSRIAEMDFRDQAKANPKIFRDKQNRPLSYRGVYNLMANKTRNNSVSASRYVSILSPQAPLQSVDSPESTLPPVEPVTLSNTPIASKKVNASMGAPETQPVSNRRTINSVMVQQHVPPSTDLSPMIAAPTTPSPTTISPPVVAMSPAVPLAPISTVNLNEVMEGKIETGNTTAKDILQLHKEGNLLIAAFLKHQMEMSNKSIAASSTVASTKVYNPVFTDVNSEPTMNGRGGYK